MDCLCRAGLSSSSIFSYISDFRLLSKLMTLGVMMPTQWMNDFWWENADGNPSSVFQENDNWRGSIFSILWKLWLNICCCVCDRPYTNEMSEFIAENYILSDNFQPKSLDQRPKEVNRNNDHCSSSYNLNFQYHKIFSNFLRLPRRTSLPTFLATSGAITVPISDMRTPSKWSY